MSTVQPKFAFGGGGTFWSKDREHLRADTMRIKVTDGEGAVMEEQERSPLPDGATGWPDRSFELEGWSRRQSPVSRRPVE